MKFLLPYREMSIFMSDYTHSHTDRQLANSFLIRSAQNRSASAEVCGSHEAPARALSWH